MHFTVGPAQLYSGVKEFLCEQIQNDLGSLSHRSKKFSEISKNALMAFRTFFDIPHQYHIFYTSSATEGLSLVSKSLCDTTSVQIQNGAFGKLWCELSTDAGKNVIIHSVEHGQKADLNTLPVSSETNLITITANETSSGVMYAQEEINEVRKKYPEKFLAVDVTSIMGAYSYDISSADAWVFSVQKAFGLPSGLGICIMSSRAVEKALLTQPYIFENLVKKMEVFQTPSTPNVLGIAGFGFVCQQFIKDFGSKEHLNAYTLLKAEYLYSSISQKIPYIHAHANSTPKILMHSVSTPCFKIDSKSGKSSSEIITKVKEHGIILGSGYGKYKDTEIRIANFPAHRMEDIKQLIEVLDSSV